MPRCAAPGRAGRRCAHHRRRRPRIRLTVQHRCALPQQIPATRSDPALMQHLDRLMQDFEPIGLCRQLVPWLDRGYSGHGGLVCKTIVSRKLVAVRDGSGYVCVRNNAGIIAAAEGFGMPYSPAINQKY